MTDKRDSITWRIMFDRYGLEAQAKSGDVCSLRRAYDEFIAEYNNCVCKPSIEVVYIGLGIAFASMLKENKIPFKKIKCRLKRMCMMDILVL